MTDVARLLQTDKQFLETPPERWLTAEQTQRLHHAMMLAPDLDTLETILRGDPVPTSRLDPTWRQAMGIK